MSPARGDLASRTDAPVATGKGPRRRSARNVLLWSAVVVGSAVLLALLGTRGTADAYLDPEGRGPSGIGALTAVLRDHGVRVHLVTTAADLVSVVGALPERSAATVAVGDSRLLTDVGTDAVMMTVRGTHRLVLLDGSSALLHTLDGDALALPGGTGPDPLRPECDAPLVHGTATIDKVNVRFVADEVGTTCYPLRDEDGKDHGGALLVLPAEGDIPETYAVGFGPALTNRHVTDQAHAALGLRLLGADPDLVLYTPSLTDAVGTGGEPVEPVSLPGWFLPALVLLALAVLTQALVSARRLGRLVPEPLPVVVKASETTHSRAELYRAARDLPRAAATLRAGTLGRLRSRLRLDRDASADEVAAALAAHGIPPGEAATLTGPDPTTEAGLVRLARDLTALEEKVTPR